MEKKNWLKWILVWLLAILVTGVALVYQSTTGPTKPVKTELWLNNNQVYQFKLPRSHGGNTGCMLELVIPDTLVTAELFYRRFPTNEQWQRIPMIRAEEKLVAMLPHQPPAGKLEYYFQFRHQGKVVRIPLGEQVVIRFRGDVPAGIIMPHVAFMFMAMLLSNLTLFLALFNFKQYRLYGIITLVTLLVGGGILGPLVQYHAFGQYWTGFPFGFDLTDNKTLIAFVFWTLAVAGNFKKKRRYLTILAAVVMLVIFSIPHSARGSELDPETGTIKTGMIWMNELWHIS